MFTPSMTNEEIEAVAYKDFLGPCPFLGNYDRASICRAPNSQEGN